MKSPSKLSAFRSAKRRSLQPALENVQVLLPLKRDDVAALLIYEHAGSPPESAFEPHVRASAQTQQCFMYIGYLKINLPADTGALRPHDASALAQIWNSIPIGDLVHHGAQGLQ
jgi:hypothetical protein